MKKSLLYTRTGDSGTTSLIGGERVAKNSPRVCAYGAVDELNAMTGLVQAHCAALRPSPSAPSLLPEINSTILSVNNTLFNIGAYLATPSPLKKDMADGPADSACPLPSLHAALTELEHQIDLLDSEVPPLRCFVLPGGSIAAAHAHVARTVCRRVEREILNLSSSGAHVDPTVLTYINRLSDYLFILARSLNHLTSTPELTWHQDSDSGV